MVRLCDEALEAILRGVPRVPVLYWMFEKRGSEERSERPEVALPGRVLEDSSATVAWQARFDCRLLVAPCPLAWLVFAEAMMSATRSQASLNSAQEQEVWSV